MAPSQYRKSHAAERLSTTTSHSVGSTSSRRVAIVNPPPATKRESHVAKILSRVNSLISESSDAELSDAKSDAGFDPGDSLAISVAPGRIPHTIRSEIVELERRLSARLDSQVEFERRLSARLESQGSRLKAIEVAASATEDTAGAADKLGLQMAKLQAAVQDVAREKPAQVPPPSQRLREEIRTEFNSRLEDMQATVDQRLTDMRSSLDSIAKQPEPPPPPLRPAPFKDPDALEGMRAELSARHGELRREVDKQLCVLRAALETVSQRPQLDAPPSGLAAPVHSLPARDAERAHRFPREQSMPPNVGTYSVSPAPSASASANASLGAGSSGASSTEGFHPLASALSFAEARVGATHLESARRMQASLAMPSGLGESSVAAQAPAAVHGLQGSESRSRRAKSPALADLPLSSSSGRPAKTAGGGDGADGWEDLQVMREGRPRGG